MRITARALIECLQGMSQEERHEVANALFMVTSYEDCFSPFELPVLIPVFDPFKKMAANWFCS